MASPLTLTERKEIEAGLKARDSFKQIAANTGRAPSTIMREVKNHFVTKRNGACGQRFNDCANRFGCQESNLCSNSECRERKCRNCRLGMCSKVCGNYALEVCGRRSEPPYVCNGCPNRHKCTLEKRFYEARAAHEEACSVRSEARMGEHLDKQELRRIRAIVSPLLKQGLSPHHIWVTNKDVLMISERTLYNLIDHGILSDHATDLHQKVSRRARRRKRSREMKVDPRCRENRTYEDYLRFMEEHPGMQHVQMDSVILVQGGLTLLTLHFPKPSTMLLYKRNHNDARSVQEVFDELWKKLGPDLFRKLFPCILTDNGSEFSNPEAIEFDSETGERRTRIFYCHPYNSNEKAEIEQNHRLVRCILPKGKPVPHTFSQEQADLIRDHINSCYRQELSDAAPYDCFELMFDQNHKVSEALGFRKIAPNDICLTPNLIR